MAATKHHDYHLVEPDPWPLIGAISGGVMFSGAVLWFHENRFGVPLMILGLLGVLVTMFNWWSNTIREAHTGHHTPVVQLHLRYGMILFIASEVMFFLAWFWAFFDSRDLPERGRFGRRCVAAQGRLGDGPVGPAASQHLHPVVLGNDGDLGAPFADPRRPARAEAGPSAHHPARPQLHRLARRGNMRTRRSPSKAASTVRPSSWRPASTASMSSSARSS